jgi:hypothetical protein
MGELLDALNAADADYRTGGAIAAPEPSNALDRLAKLVREAPLPSLAIAFLLGVIISRRR